MAIFVRFVATPLRNYSAILQVTSKDTAQQISIATANLRATVVPAPTLTVGSPCTGPDATRTINFGRSQQFVKATCTVTVQNPGAQPLLISLASSVPPNGFRPSFGTSFPSRPARLARSFSHSTPPPHWFIQPYSRWAPIIYTLFGVRLFGGVARAGLDLRYQHFLQRPAAHAFGGAGGPSPVAASGSLILTFSSAVSTAADDAAIQFVATSKRIASFTVKAGETAILLNGQPNIVFSTGTTAGRIAFRIDPGVFGIAGDPGYRHQYRVRADCRRRLRAPTAS